MTQLKTRIGNLEAALLMTTSEAYELTACVLGAVETHAPTVAATLAREFAECAARVFRRRAVLNQEGMALLSDALAAVIKQKVTGEQARLIGQALRPKQEESTSC